MLDATKTGFIVSLFKLHLLVNNLVIMEDRCSVFSIVFNSSV